MLFFTPDLGQCDNSMAKEVSSGLEMLVCYFVPVAVRTSSTDTSTENNMNDLSLGCTRRTRMLG